jgi:long-subunit acyl-CoA synthetase (AMP-forming)
MPERRLKRLLGIPILGTLVRRKVLRQLGLDHVRVAGSGAAPLPAATMNWYRDLGLELLEGYGMTELFGLSHMCRPGTVRVGYVGQVMNDVDCRLSENGEVLIRSPGNTLGYYLDPDKTPELFTEDGYVRTGDRGTIDEMGRLKITGRVKEIFKTSKGKYVAPAPIENKLLAHPAVEACCVTGANRPQPFGLLMLGPQALDSGGKGADRADLAQSLAEHLASVNAELDPHEQLQFVVVVSDEWDVENDFLTPTLKIKRDVIDAAYGPQVDGWYSARRPVVWQDDN